ncbi:hypothetical protein ACQJBY_008766 [Aegilops geniculata]
MEYLITTAMGVVKKALHNGVLLAEAYVDTIGDPEKYNTKLCEKFLGIKFVVAKKADSLYPAVRGARIFVKGFPFNLLFLLSSFMSSVQKNSDACVE